MMRVYLFIYVFLFPWGSIPMTGISEGYVYVASVSFFLFYLP